MAKIKEEISMGDIVKVKIKISDYKKEPGLTDEMKSLVNVVANDLKTLKGEIILKEGDTEGISLVKFDKHKSWMKNFMGSDNEMYFFDKYITVVKKADKIELFFKTLDSRCEKSVENTINNEKENIDYNRREIENYFRSIVNTQERIVKSGEVIKDIENKKIDNSLEKLLKNKKIEHVKGHSGNLYILTKPLVYRNLNDEVFIDDLQYVIKIQPESSARNFSFYISNVSTYREGETIESPYHQHCCVSNQFIPCLGSVMMKTLAENSTNLPMSISTLMMFLEKPDYETPHINETAFKNSYVRYEKMIDKDNIEKAFDLEYKETLK